MCGIGGRVAKEPLNVEVVTQVLDVMCKRGPDGIKHKNVQFSNFSLDLFFSRLAIIDESENAMQPMAYKGYVILLNGEIYNYKELKKSLEIKHGSQNWESNGDVEVALRYLVLNGVNSIIDFDGMFALALVDLQNETICFGRDYFGEKPLYLLKAESNLSFGSEPKIIWTVRNHQSKINRNHLKNFLLSGYKSIFKSNDDFFEEVHRVEPGTIETYSLRSLSRTTIFQFRKFDKSPHKTEKSQSRDEILRNVKSIVIDSVGKRLESDVPIAVCLSGGVDSGLIASIAKKEFGVALHAYTLASNDPRYSEATNASLVGKYLNLDHSLVEIRSENFIYRLKEIIKYHEAPISTISYYVQNFLMEKIHTDGFKVSLMGSGADEIFTGYYDHHLLYLASINGIDPELFQTSLNNWKNKILPIVRNPVYKQFDLYIKQPEFREHIYEGSEIMKAMLIQPTHNFFVEKQLSLSLVRNRMLNELFYEVVPVILHEDDRNSMMYSIENRSPFLSTKILGSMLEVEDMHLINNGLSKSILREAFDGYLPSEILYSPKKIGFNSSILELCDFQSDEFREFICKDSIFWEIVDKNKITKFFNNLGQEDIYNKIAFNIISTKAFCDIFG